MHRSTAPAILLAVLLCSPTLVHSQSPQPAAPEPPREAVSQASTGSTAAAPPSEAAPPDTPPPSRDQICDMIETAASAVALPFEFLARLIWQESRFNPQAVSPAGAQGIAQFMPKTAGGRGLADPFAPGAALQESAELLRELRDRFGNLGLAAAAYNAGPKRVQDWLAKRGSLPRETADYVAIITGHRPEKWAGAEPPAVQDAALQGFRCGDIAKLVAQRRHFAVERLANLVVQRWSHSGETRPTHVTAASRHQPNLKVAAKDVVQPRSDRRGAKAAQRTPPARPAADGRGGADKADRGARTQRLAGNGSKAGSQSRPLENKAASVARERRSADGGAAMSARKSGPAGGRPGVRVAANARGGAEKSCSQVKGGGRRPCRAA